MKIRSRIPLVIAACLLALNFALVTPPHVAHAGTIYRVIPLGKTTGDCGDTWANGCALQYALATKSADGDELWVKQGTYTPSSTFDRRVAFVLKMGVALYGGFAGTETAREPRSWEDHPTILSGDLNGDDGPNFANYADNSYHVIFGNNVGSSTILDGFTISGGNASSVNTQERLGGGIYTLYSCPTLNNILFLKNQAQDDAGGMYSLDCSNTFNNLTFSGNKAGRNGGGMYSDYYPGYVSQMVLNGATFINNSAAHGGGGIYEIRKLSTLINTSFTQNSADFGGGMYIDTDNPGQNTILTNVTFTGNTATSRGGGLYIYSSYVTLTNVIFTQNSADHSGGGMGNYASHPTLTNVTFSGNTAPTNAGGAILNFGSSISGGSNAIIRNSLLWGNPGGEVVNDTSGGDDSSATISYSIVQGCNPGGSWNGACGVNAGNNPADANPNFGTNLHLSAGSPAIDTGNNTFLNGLAIDMDGNPRVVGGVVDLGVYEYQHGAAVYRVIPGGRTTGACDSWANGCDLQYALAVKAVAGDELWVKMGTHKPTSALERTASFVLKSGVAIYGGFNGTETARGQRSWQNNLTILSGDLSGNDGANFANNSENSYHIVKTEGVIATAILDGFTIRGGNANGGYPNNYGGGVFILSGNPSLANLVISGNYASNLGGGIDVNGQPRMTNITISGNTAPFGGGMANASNPLLLGTVFSNNTASSFGGGLYNYNNSTPFIYNSLFYGNTASRGGGVYNTAGSPRLVNATFWGNTATNLGSGIYNTSGSSPFIQNSILWGDLEAGNLGGEIRRDASGDPSVPLISYSLVYGCNPGGAWNAACGADNGQNQADADPKYLNSAQANFRLGSGSPGIDTGSDDPVNGGVTTDLDGNPRKAGAHVDLGAYEHRNTPPQVTSFNILTFAGQDLNFSLSQFTYQFSDADGDALASIRITSLPDHGSLYLGAAAVTLNQEIPAGAIGGLRLTLPAQWTGSTSFGWNASDGEAYADEAAAVFMTFLSPPNFDVFLPLVIR